MASELFGRFKWVFLHELLDSRQPQVQKVHMVLCKQSYSKAIVQEPISINKLKITSQRLDQSGLACSVRTNECNPGLKVNVDVYTRKHDIFCVPKLCFIKSAQRRRKFFWIWEDENTSRIWNNICNKVYSLDRLDSWLHQWSAFRIVSELVNKLLNVTNFVQLTVFCFFHVAFSLIFGFFELFKVTFVVGKLLTLKVNDFITHGVQEVPSMGHY